jgi:hypothetical protein
MSDLNSRITLLENRMDVIEAINEKSNSSNWLRDFQTQILEQLRDLRTILYVEHKKAEENEKKLKEVLFICFFFYFIVGW